MAMNDEFWPVVPVSSQESTVRFTWVCCHSEIWIECLQGVACGQSMPDSMEWSTFLNRQIISKVVLGGPKYMISI